MEQTRRRLEAAKNFNIPGRIATEENKMATFKPVAPLDIAEILYRISMVAHVYVTMSRRTFFSLSMVRLAYQCLMFGGSLLLFYQCEHVYNDHMLQPVHVSWHAPTSTLLHMHSEHSHRSSGP